MKDNKFQFNVNEKLVINTEDDVLVNSNKGKFKIKKENSESINWVILNGQKGVTCSIKSRTKLFYSSLFTLNGNSKKLQDFNEAKKLLKPLKKILLNDPVDYQALLEQSKLALEYLSYEPTSEVIKNPFFINLKNEINNQREKYKLDPVSSIKCLNNLFENDRARAFYYTLMDKIDSLFGFKDTHWSPNSGFAGLQQALRDHGQILFVGKYGTCFHGSQNIFIYSPASSEYRQVYAFKKGTLRSSTWTHCVIVDQAKIIDGKEYVIFKDPHDQSNPDQPEKAYILSFASFTERLCGKYGNNNPDEPFYGLNLDFS